MRTFSVTEGDHEVISIITVSEILEVVGEVYLEAQHEAAVNDVVFYAGPVQHVSQLAAGGWRGQYSRGSRDPVILEGQAHLGSNDENNKTKILCELRVFFNDENLGSPAFL